MVPKQTSAKPKTIDGVTFRCWRLPYGKTEWRSDDGRLAAGVWSSGATYYAEIGLQRFNTRFRSLENAMRYTVKHRGHKSEAEMIHFAARVS
jgi:hypothetical protein